MTLQQPLMIVDDDMEIREVIGALLEAEGYAVAKASDGAEALRQLRLGSPRRLGRCLLNLGHSRHPPMNRPDHCRDDDDTPFSTFRGRSPASGLESSAEGCWSDLDYPHQHQPVGGASAPPTRCTRTTV